MYTTGNAAVDAIGQMNLEGNIIPHTWFDSIKFDSGKADLTGIVILSEIIYWHRPTYVKNEATGMVVGVKKKFKADLLQRSYESFADQFGITKRQAKEAVTRLEDLGLIKRHFRTINANGTKLGNVLFIEVLHSNVIAMTFKRHRGDVVTSEVSRSNATPMTLERQTNTEITTKNTTENTTRDYNNQPDMEFVKVKDFYESNFSLVSPIIGEMLGGLVDDFDTDLVLYAFEITALNPKVTNPMRYATSILNGWQKNLVTNRQQAEIYESKKRGEHNGQNNRGSSQGNAGPSNRPTVFGDYCSD
ncbi:DnaD domain-containing protein [Rummeliibacillus sp. BSL5]